MLSSSTVFESTGLRDDSEISSIMDQYGPSSGVEDEGLEPVASWSVGSLVEVGGWLLGE